MSVYAYSANFCFQSYLYCGIHPCHRSRIKLWLVWVQFLDFQNSSCRHKFILSAFYWSILVLLSPYTNKHYFKGLKKSSARTFRIKFVVIDMQSVTVSSKTRSYHSRLLERSKYFLSFGAIIRLKVHFI